MSERLITFKRSVALLLDSGVQEENAPFEADFSSQFIPGSNLMLHQGVGQDGKVI